MDLTGKFAKQKLQDLFPSVMVNLYSTHTYLIYNNNISYLKTFKMPF